MPLTAACCQSLRLTAVHCLGRQERLAIEAAERQKELEEAEAERRAIAQVTTSTAKARTLPPPDAAALGPTLSASPGTRLGARLSSSQRFDDR